MKQSLVSIIVPCYNLEKYIKKCLLSLTSQTYNNIEILVINDGGKDNSEKIVAEFAKNDNRIILINKKNGGVSTARNTGLEYAKGKYISFIDGDDYVSDKFIETLVNGLESYNCDLSCIKPHKVMENKDYLFKNNIIEKPVFFEGKDGLIQMISGVKFDICVWNKLYKKELIANLKFDEQIRYGEDYLFNYYYFKKVNRVAFFKTPQHAYVQREGSLVNSKFNNNKLTTIKGLKEAIEDSKNDYVVNEYAKAWYCLVNVELAYYIFKTKYKDKEVAKEVLSAIKNNLKFLRKSKRIQKYRRYLVPVAYTLFVMFFKMYKLI